MKRTNGGSLLGRVGRKSEMRRTSTGGARSVDIWPASALEFSFGTLLVILLAALKMPRAVTPSLLAQGTSGTVSNVASKWCSLNDTNIRTIEEMSRRLKFQ